MGNRGIFLILEVIFVSLLISNSVYSVGLAFRGEPSKTIYFTPGYNETFGYNLVPTKDSIKGYNIYTEMEEGSKVDLTPYFTVEPSEIGHASDWVPFQVHASLPEKIAVPGTHTIYVAVEDKLAGDKEMFSAKTKVKGRIRVNVLEEGIRISSSINAKNINEGENTTITITVTNLGTTPIYSMRSDVDIFDKSGNHLGEFELKNNKLLQGWQSTEMTKEYDSSKLISGEYEVKAKLYYYNYTDNLETNFFIGTLDIQVTNHTRLMYYPKINDFQIGVKSLWNSPVELYGTIKIDDVEEKTATIRLNPLEENSIKAYFNTVGTVPATNKNAYITLHYDNKQTFYEGQVDIIPEINEEKPLKMEYDFWIIVLLILIILVLFNAVVLLLWKNKRDGEKKKGKGDNK